MPKETRDGFYQRGAIWWTRLDGKRTSTGCKDLEAARLWRTERERELASPAYAASRATTLLEAGEKFLMELKVAGRSESTVSYYRTKFGALLRVWGAKLTLAEVTPAKVQDYVTQRLTEHEMPDGSVELPVDATTVRKEVKSLQTLMRAAKHRSEWEGDVDMLEPLRLGGEYKARKRHPSKEEFVKIVLNLRERGMEDRAGWLCLAIATAGRFGEVNRLTVDAFDFTNGMFTLSVTKTKKSEGPTRTRPILPEHEPLIRYALKHSFNEDGAIRQWAGPNVNQTLARVCDELKIQRYSPNDFRRAHTSWLRNEGVPDNLLAFQLGHQSTAMVQKVYGQMDTTAAAKLLLSARVGRVGCDVSVPTAAIEDHSAPTMEAQKATNSSGKERDRAVARQTPLERDSAFDSAYRGSNPRARTSDSEEDPPSGVTFLYREADLSEFSSPAVAGLLLSKGVDDALAGDAVAASARITAAALALDLVGDEDLDGRAP